MIVRGYFASELSLVVAPYWRAPKRAKQLSIYGYNPALFCTVADRNKTESQTLKQNHKTLKQNHKTQTKSQNSNQNRKIQKKFKKTSKQNHKTHNRLTKPKTETQNSKTESQNPKQKQTEIQNKEQEKKTTTTTVTQHSLETWKRKFHDPFLLSKVTYHEIGSAYAYEMYSMYFKKWWAS